MRLNIRKATLRDWRQQFAAHLREQGIAANATERAVRGATRIPKTDGVFRADDRDSSTYVQAKLTSYVRRDRNQPGPGKATLVATRREVEQGWYVVHDVLGREGQVFRQSAINTLVEQEFQAASVTASFAPRSRKAMTCSRETDGKPSRKSSMVSPASM